MTAAYDVIVAGVGGMGSATCWQLAKRGLRVLGLERFDIGHTMGSSHGLTRIIRLGYAEGDQYVPLVLRAHQLWRETGDLAGTQLLHVTGSLDMERNGGERVTGALKSCLAYDLRHRMLDRRELNRRYPQFNLPEGHVGLWQPDGGFIASEQAIRVHVALARAHGADIRTNEPLMTWKTTVNGGVTVTTERDTYSAGSLVLTSGGWLGETSKSIAPLLSTVKQAIGWFPLKQPQRFAPDNFPVFVLGVEEGDYYGFPAWEHPGLKVGGPHLGRVPVAINDPDRTPTLDQERRLTQFLKRYIPDAAGDAIALKGCIYTVTPDEHFIIDRLPEAPQVVFASACSGHGYKFASAIGEVLADLATTANSRFDLTAFSLDRFKHAA